MRQIGGGAAGGGKTLDAWEPFFLSREERKQHGSSCMAKSMPGLSARMYASDGVGAHDDVGEVVLLECRVST